jgi:hypothetical protein
MIGTYSSYHSGSWCSCSRCCYCCSRGCLSWRRLRVVLHQKYSGHSEMEPFRPRAHNRFLSLINSFTSDPIVTITSGREWPELESRRWPGHLLDSSSGHFRPSFNSQSFLILKFLTSFLFVQWFTSSLLPHPSSALAVSKARHYQYNSNIPRLLSLSSSDYTMIEHTSM